ncbi:MAG: acyltransferase [Betaproteobacteria bacterium]|nr:acyltransferase [Betaproteobacteria bacterium]
MSAIIAAAADSASRHGESAVVRVDYLDGWRGLAILLVLQEHFFSLRGFASGSLGVNIFFCLSGLLISRILFVQRVPLSTFYKHRISRIFPVFFLFVVLVYGTAVLMGHPGTWPEFIATITLLRTYLPIYPDIWHTGLPIGHLWSLNVEEHGYIILSALTVIAAVRHRSGWLLVLLGVATIGIHLAYYRYAALAPANYEIRTETAAAYLLISAGYFLLRERFVPLVKPWMPLAAIGLAVACYWRGIPEWFSAVATPFLLAFAVNHLGQAKAAVLTALAAAPLRLLGICSYSVYLWQQPFYEFRASFPPGLALVCALLTGAASFYLFENPVRTWLNRNW